MKRKAQSDPQVDLILSVEAKMLKAWPIKKVGGLKILAQPDRPAVDTPVRPEWEDVDLRDETEQ